MALAGFLLVEKKCVRVSLLLALVNMLTPTTRISRAGRDKDLFFFRNRCAMWPVGGGVSMNCLDCTLMLISEFTADEHCIYTMWISYDWLIFTLRGCHMVCLHCKQHNSQWHPSISQLKAITWRMPLASEIMCMGYETMCFSCAKVFFQKLDHIRCWYQWDNFCPCYYHW